MANNSNRLYRNFVILQEDERGHSSSEDKVLSGYSKIEAKGDNCKISFYVQNLRSDDNYCMMVICSKKETKQIINLGAIDISGTGKGESTREYYTSNIGGADIPFEKVTGAAIAKVVNGEYIYIMCGFLNGQQPTDDWKTYRVVKAIEGKRKTVEKDIKKSNIKQEEKRSEETKIKASKEKKDTIKEIPKEIAQETAKEIAKELPKESIRGKFDNYEDEIEAIKEFDPAIAPINGSMGEFFEAIAEGFEEYKDGFDEVKYTKWYKVPVKDLYEMCNMSNYNRYTLAYYPMLNYYPYIKKHGYFMLGYKCDSKGNLTHIVYGVPGKKDKDCQPYDGKTGFVTWMRCKDKDDMGLWLMFYDFKNSTVVVPMK